MLARRELLMLIEADKRGSKNSLALTYSASDGEQFYVPPNVYILGLMNTADRSLALVDYALRRRFAFWELHPLFDFKVFTDFLAVGGTEPRIALEICRRMNDLNQAISEDQNLGPGFAVGHSYFCGSSGPITEQLYSRVIHGQIIPLLKEYWFDDPSLVSSWVDKLELSFK